MVSFSSMARPTRIILKSLSTLSIGKIMSLLGLVLRHPFFTLLTFHATQKAFLYSKKHFPNSHSTDGKGNAFRHAYWCCLIMMYCCKISSPKKSLEWCKKFTDMHEELFPNEPLQKKMDLHNNQVGMDLFMQMLNGIHRQFFERNFFIPIIKEKLKTAQVLKEEHQPLGEELVYLEE